MRRAIARGRVFPQSYSTDRRYGRLSLKACALFPLMWVNGDDQGRLSGDPEEVKYSCCPNIDHITKADIPLLLEELGKNYLIRVYETSRSTAIQLLDWWNVQRLQWAWPSEYPAPDGWQDRLRYKKNAKEVVTENWYVSGDDLIDAQVKDAMISGESSGEHDSQRFPHLPKEKEYEEGRGRGRGRGRGNSPECSGETSPSPGAFLSEFNSIFLKLMNNYDQGWGKGMPDSRQTAQLRDLAEEIAAAGGVEERQVYDAFREAAVVNKLHISYVRAVLLDWLGVARARAP